MSGTNEHIARARNHHHLRHVYTHIAWQMVCADIKLLLVPHQRHGPCGEATLTRGRRRPEKSCDGVLAGCRCNIDDTAVCFVDYCSMFTRVLQVLFCFCCRRERSAKRVIVLWALGRVTAPHAHRTARPMHMASIDSLRMTAVENRAHATAAAATTAAVLVARAWSTIFSTYISHRSHVFFSFL